MIYPFTNHKKCHSNQYVLDQSVTNMYSGTFVDKSQFRFVNRLESRIEMGRGRHRNLRIICSADEAAMRPLCCSTLARWMVEMKLKCNHTIFTLDSIRITTYIG